MSDDDEDISSLNAWRAGDREAGEALIARHYDSVMRFFRTKAGEQADDLVQRTLLRCVEPTNSFRGDSSFRAFLFGIARNVLYEHIRSKVRDNKADPDFGVSSILDLNPGASTMVFYKSAQRQLVRALQRIPVDLQLTLELFYWEELSVDELAKVLDVPHGTVKSRLHRGRALLREAMDGMPEESGPLSLRAEFDRWISDVREQLPDEPEPSEQGGAGS